MVKLGTQRLILIKVILFLVIFGLVHHAIRGVAGVAHHAIGAVRGVAHHLLGDKAKEDCELIKQLLYCVKMLFTVFVSIQHTLVLFYFYLFFISFII